MTDIVIGPQGVFEVTQMTGTHRGPWAGVGPKGRSVKMLILIHFPWNPADHRFGGERISHDRAAMIDQVGAAK